MLSMTSSASGLSDRFLKLMILIVLRSDLRRAKKRLKAGTKRTKRDA